MKDILVLTLLYKPFIGGAERYAEEFVLRRPAGVRLTVFTARMRRSSPCIEIIDGVHIHRLGIGMSCDKFLFPFLALLRALPHSYDYSYAIMESYAGLAALLIYWIKKIPYILNLQSGTLDMPHYRRLIRLVFPLYAAIHRQARMVHAASSALRARALSLGVPSITIFVIPNGVDCARYANAGSAPVAGRIIVVARLEEAKGVRYMIEAMRFVSAAIPNAHLVIAGDGALRLSLEAMARKQGVARAISFLGAVPPISIPALFATGECFVCPSVAEGFGISVIEALAAGVPVVAACVGGIPDIITDGVDGTLVPPRNPEALALGVIQILRDNARRACFSMAGKLRAKEFDWDVVVPRVYALFE